MLQRTLDLHQE